MIVPNDLMLELKRLITHAFDNEKEFIETFFSEFEEASLEECYMAGERTKIKLNLISGAAREFIVPYETTIPTLNFISWVNDNL